MKFVVKSSTSFKRAGAADVAVKVVGDKNKELCQRIGDFLKSSISKLGVSVSSSKPKVKITLSSLKPGNVSINVEAAKFSSSFYSNVVRTLDESFLFYLDSKKVMFLQDKKGNLSYYLPLTEVKDATSA